MSLRRGVRRVVTDGARWYSLAASWARLQHIDVWRDVRSYVERFVYSVKDRLRGFDCQFPVASAPALVRLEPHLRLGGLLQLR